MLLKQEAYSADMTKNRFRRICYNCLHEPVDNWAKALNSLIAILIVISVGTIPFYLIASLAPLLPIIEIFEWVTIVIFSIEYFLRAWSAPKPLHYIFSWFGMIDFIAVFPFYLGIFGIYHMPHALLSLRLLRILKLGRIYYAERMSVGKLAQESHGQFVPLHQECIETIVYKHPLTFTLMIIPPIVFVSVGFLILAAFGLGPAAIAIAVICFAFAIIFFLKAWLDFHYDVIYVTNQRIIMQNRQLFGYKLNDISYPAITNIRPDNTGFLSYLFGYGNIKIETAAANGEREFSNISDPLKVVQKISANRAKAMARGEYVLQKGHEQNS